MVHLHNSSLYVLKPWYIRPTEVLFNNLNKIAKQFPCFKPTVNKKL